MHRLPLLVLRYETFYVMPLWIAADDLMIESSSVQFNLQLWIKRNECKTETSKLRPLSSYPVKKHEAITAANLIKLIETIGQI